MTEIISAVPSSVLHPSLCLFFFIEPVPMLSHCVDRKSASCLSIWTPMDTRVATSRQANRPSQISRDARARVQLTSRPPSAFCIDLMSFLSVCHLSVCFSVPHQLASLGATVRVRARLRLCVCASSRHLFAVGSAARSRGFCLPPRGRGGIRKTDPQQIPSLSLTRRPQIHTVY